jgi:hypothetical protein
MSVGTGQLQQEHGVLLGHADWLIDQLRHFRGRLEPGGGPAYMHHYDFADRAAALGDHLAGARLLVEPQFYASAFVLVRTALEHYVLDHLLFLGRRHVQVFQGVDDHEYEKLVEAVGSKEMEWARAIDVVKRTKNGVRLIRNRGLRVQSPGSTEPGYELSFYFAVFEEHSPFMGPPSHQPYLDDGLSPPGSQEEWALHNKLIYSNYLRWESVKASLELNGFYTERQLIQLDVHYRFLSAFTHAHTKGYERLVSGYDHYCSELILLYIIELGVRELQILLQMADQPPPVAIAGRAAIEKRMAEAGRAAAHLWFPGGQPHSLDHFDEANRRAWRQHESGQPMSPCVPPEQLDPAEVGYYADPLRRLARMHATVGEVTTGFVYVSPWPREDAIHT